jgi:hypothetical protein
VQRSADSTKRRSAQQRLAAERQAALRAREAAAKRRKFWLAMIPVGVVIVVVLGLVVAKVINGSRLRSGEKAQKAAAQVVKDITTVPVAAFDAVGPGAIKTVPTALTDGPDMVADGKIRILYVGAEFCPYCAAERWSVVVALSRFGTWSGLGQTESAPAPEVFPSTKTLTFHGATFTGELISFTGVETKSNQVNSAGTDYEALDTLGADDQALFAEYDAPPYVDSQSQGAIPFMLVGGKYLISGASYDPGVLEGKSHAQIAAALQDPNSDIAQAILGTANVLTAAICALTKNAPTAVCTSPGVIDAAKKLDAKQPDA